MIKGFAKFDFEKTAVWRPCIWLKNYINLNLKGIGSEFALLNCSTMIRKSMMLLTAAILCAFVVNAQQQSPSAAQLGTKHISHQTVAPIAIQVAQHTQLQNAQAVQGTAMGSKYGTFSPGISVPATTEQCKTAIIDNAFMSDPAYKNARDRAEALTQKILRKWDANPLAKAPPVYTLPIVFHVIHKGEAIGTGTNLSDAQVSSAIDALNRDYRRTADDGGIGQGAGPDTEIQFCLAVRDPNGNGHSGINRVDGTTVANYASQGIIGSNETDIKDLSRWPNTDYINIWIVSEIDDNGADVASPSSWGGGTLGYAYLPTNPVTFNSQRDGIVAVNLCVGNDPTQALGYRLWPWGGLLNRTLTHEMGHHLDLYHTFDGGSCTETNCNTQGDLVCDTPPTTQQTNCGTPACSGTQQVENYMDYTGEACADMFSAGQTTRMRAAISGVRVALTTSMGCAPVNALDASVSSVTYPSGTICATTFTPELVLTNFGGTTLTSCTINYDVDGGPNQVYNWTGSLVTGASDNVTLASMTTAAGAHTFNAASDQPNGSTDQNMGNDATAEPFTSIVGNTMTLTILQDQYGSETTWEVQDGGGATVVSGGPYTDLGSAGTATHVETFCLADGCYDFIINDSYGDGICCAYGNGSYDLVEDATATSMAAGGTFTSTETTNFCVPAGPAAPIADFVANVTTIGVGGTVNFTDLSVGNPAVNAWTWTFTGGTPAASAVQNPAGIQYNTPGFYDVTLFVDNGVGNDTETKVQYIEVVTGGTGGACDTVTNIGATDTLTYYGLTGQWGYYPGHNENTILAYADPYTAAVATNVQTIMVPVATADFGNAANTVDFNIYADNAGQPGAILGTETVQISTLQAGAYNLVDFTTPVPVAGAFWAGFELTYNAGDTLTVYTAQNRGGGGIETTWVDVAGTWQSTYALFGNGLATSLGLEVLMATDATIPNFSQSATSICVGDVMVIDATTSQYTTDYFWDLPNGTPATSTNATENVTYAAVGSYPVKLYTQGGCRIDSMIGTVTVAQGAALTVTPTDASCGASDGIIDIVASGGTAPYSYSIDNGSTFQPASSFTGLAVGTYDVVVTGSGGGCPTTQQVTISNATGPIFGSAPANDESCAAACDGDITVNGTGGTAPLQYSIDGGATFQAGNTFAGLCPGTYDIVIEDATGCQDVSQVVLSGPSAITYSATPADATCGATNGSIDLSGSGGGVAPLQYSIDGGGTFQASAVFSGLAAGSYNTVVLDANGCQITGLEIIGGGGTITVSASQVNETCGNNNGSATATPTGGTAPYTYVWSSGSTSATETGLGAGTYTCTITDASGCAEVVQVTITNAGGVNGTISSNQTICAGDTEVLVSSGGTGYSWDDGSGVVGTSSTIAVNPTSTTTYTVTITDASGCSLILSATITVDQYPTTAVCCDQTICDGDIVTLTASGGTSYFWNTTDTTGTIQASPSSQTTYSVIAYNGSCPGLLESVVISVDPSPTSVANADNVNVAVGATVNFNNVGSLGTAFLWDFDNMGATSTLTSPSHTYNSVGVYTVILTATLGNCTMNDTIVINVGIDGIGNNALDQAIELFPNPTSGQLNVNINFEQAQDISLMVYNTIGEAVRTTNEKDVTNASYLLDLSTEAEGVYFVRLSTADGSITHRIVVTR